MPKVSPIQTSFNAGEFSPLLYGRVDADRYKAALKVCKNMLPTVQGALTRRSGTKFAATTKYRNRKSRLIPFQFSTVQAYTLLFGGDDDDGYIRFFKDNGIITESPITITGGITNANPGVVTAAAHGLANGNRVIIDLVVGMNKINGVEFEVASVTTNTFALKDIDSVNFSTVGLGSYVSGGTVSRIYEVQTFYTEEQVMDLKFTQSADVLYLVHPEWNPVKLLRNGHTDWDFESIEFIDGPYTALIDSNAKIPLGPSINAVNGGTIPGFHPYSANAVGVNPISVSDIIDDGTGQCRVFTATSMAWMKTGDQVLVRNVVGVSGINTNVYTVAVNADQDFVLVGSSFNGAYVSGGDIFHYYFTAAREGSNFRIKLNGETDYRWGRVLRGLGTSANIALSGSYIGTITNSTIYRFGPWSAGAFVGVGQSWPSWVTFHEDRLCFGGSPNYPQRVDLSASGDYENFGPSDLDGTVTAANAMALSLNSNSVDATQWGSSDEKGLLVGTVANEWVIKASSLGEALSPTNVAAKRVSAYGSQGSMPIQAGKSTIYIQSSGRKLRELLYFYDVDGFRANDMSLLSEHITQSGLVELAFQKSPQSIVWAPRQDGVLTSLTYDRDIESVKAAWARHILGGYGDAANNHAMVESVAVIPSPDASRDELWVIVKRFINGKVQRYVEYMTRIFEDDMEQRDGFFVDCGLTYDNPLTIESISKANPGVVTITAHGLNNGDKFLLSNLNGMTQLEGVLGIVANKTANTFELHDIQGANINTTAYSTYIDSGELRKLVTTITGMNHLEGETVAVVVDGATHPDRVVTNGAISLNTASATVHVGYQYNSDMQILRTDAGSADGTSIGKKRRTTKLKIMLHRTLNFKFGTDFDSEGLAAGAYGYYKMDRAEFRNARDPAEKAPPLYSGIWKEEFEADFDTENQVAIRQSDPLPFTILAIMTELRVEDET